MANHDDNTVSVINGKTNTVTDTISLSTNSVGYGASSIDVNPSTNVVYVVNGNHKVSVINGKTNTVTDTISLVNGAYMLAVNPSTNVVYVVNYANNAVSVIDGKT